MIVSILLFAHFSACIWLILGMEQEGSWIRKSDVFSEYSHEQLYVLAIYWTFTVFSTVGYGDYSWGTKGEMLFCILLEFGGMTFFSLTMGITTDFVKHFGLGFKAMLNEKMGNLDIWL